MVHDNENLRTHIAPVLKQRKEDCSSTDNKQSGEGKDKDKDDKIDNLVSKLSALIDSEVRRKTCIQLKPDLKKFMEDMMKQNCKGKPNIKDEDDDDDEEDEDDEGDENSGGYRKRRSLVSDCILVIYCLNSLHSLICRRIIRRSKRNTVYSLNSCKNTINCPMKNKRKLLKSKSIFRIMSIFSMNWK